MTKLKTNKILIYSLVGVIVLVGLYLIFDFRSGSSLLSDIPLGAQQSQSGNPANYNATPATRTDGDASALEVDSKGNLKVIEDSTYSQISTSTLVKTGAGKVYGFFVSNTGGSLYLYDSLTGTGTSILDNVTPSASGVFNFPAAIEFITGLYAKIVGTLSLTIFYK